MKKMTEIKRLEDLQSLKGHAVVRVYTTWCPVCKGYARAFAQVATGFDEAEVTFCRCNAEVAEDIVDALNLESVPVTLFVKNGKVAARLGGAIEAPRLDMWIRKYL